MNTPLSTYLAIAPQSPEEAVLRLLIELGIQVVGADEGSLLVLDETAGDLVFAMTVGGSGSENALKGQRVPLGQGLTGLAAATHEVQLGSPTYSQVQQAKQGGQTDGPQAVIAAPMLVADSVVGVITAVSFAQGKRFGSREAELYARVAAVAGVVVQQRHRLSALEGESAAPGAPGADAASGHESAIARSVSRIATARPDALAQVAHIVESLEALCLSSSY
jgi:GAF domain-containing protein